MRLQRLATPVPRKGLGIGRIWSRGFQSTGAKIGEVWFEGLGRLAAAGEVSIHLGGALGAGASGRCLCGAASQQPRKNRNVARPGGRARRVKSPPDSASRFRRNICARRRYPAKSKNCSAWHEAAPGDTFFIPAGTVHAIGAGLALCEIQQRSDVTYRLYDYGRPRELHLEQALAVSPAGAACGARERSGERARFRCEHFTVGRDECCRDDRIRSAAAGLRTLIVIEGEGQLWRQPGPLRRSLVRRSRYHPL